MKVNLFISSFSNTYFLFVFSLLLILFVQVIAKVEFEKEDSAQTFLDNYDEAELDGNTLKIELL